jgi:hypothetical protein
MDKNKATPFARQYQEEEATVSTIAAEADNKAAAGMPDSFSAMALRISRFIVDAETSVVFDAIQRDADAEQDELVRIRLVC